MTIFRSSWLSASVHATSSHLHWLALGLGLAASAFFGVAILGQPSGPNLSSADNGQGDFAHFLPALLTETASEGQPYQTTHFLNSISGETFAPGASYAAATDLLPQDRPDNIAPVMWDELSDTASCLTVTTKNGETFSFRILGIDPTPSAGANKSEPAVNLAVAACSSRGKFIEKAVIEPDATPAAKSATSARSL